MCRGCELPASNTPVSTTASFYAIGNRIKSSNLVMCLYQHLVRGVRNSLPKDDLSYFDTDWDPTALHLRYLAAAERAWVEDSSVVASRYCFSYMHGGGYFRYGGADV